MVKEKGYTGYGTYCLYTLEVSPELLGESVRQARKYAEYFSNKWPELDVLELRENNFIGPTEGDQIIISVGMFQSLGAAEKWERSHIIGDPVLTTLMEEQEKTEKEEGKKFFLKGWHRKYYTVHFSSEITEEVQKSMESEQKKYTIESGILTETT